jgi:hypothetical protein
MPRHSGIWMRSQDKCYYTTIKGVKYNLGADLEVAQIKFRQLVGDEGFKGAMEPLVASICDAAAHIARHMPKDEAMALLTAMYAMKEKAC